MEPPNPADVTEAEKVLRGEQNYAGTFVDGEDENFIDDERCPCTKTELHAVSSVQKVDVTRPALG